MKRLPLLRQIAAIAGVALLVPTSSIAGTPDGKAPAKNAAEIAAPHPMYLGTVNSGFKANDAYIDGNFSIVAPVWSTLGADSTLSGGVLFLEPYISYGEGGEIASSLGLGYRYLFGSQSVSAFSKHDGHQASFLEEGVYVGANLFVDMLDTEANNQFWQLGVGLEIGTRYLELRGNYYIPLSDKQLAEEFRTREVRQSSRTTTSQSMSVEGDPYATGYSVAQDALYTTLATTTLTTTTIERLFRRYEEGMEGWDAEVALLLPWVDKYMDVRLIGGYYSFDNQPFGPQTGGSGNVEGFKAGLEVRPVPAIILNGTWYEDDRLTGSDWTAGVQLQLPFEAGDLGDGKNFWSRMGDSFRPRRRHLAERVAEPVRRQNAAVKLATSQEEEKTSTTSKVQRVTRVVERRKGILVLADDVVFVNNGGAVGNGIQAGTYQAEGADGTAQRPFNTLTEGAFTAGTFSNNSGRVWNVYTQGGTGTDYQDNVTVVGSTNFISSQSHIYGVNGIAFGGVTARPNVFGGIKAENVGYLGVTGYAFQNGFVIPYAKSIANGIGIQAKNVGEVYVNSNTFNEMREGVVLEATGSHSGTALVQNNAFRHMENGVRLYTHGSAELLAEVALNNFSGYIDTGITGTSFGRSKLEVNIAQNELDGDFNNGIKLEGSHGSKILADVTANTLEGEFDDNGIELATEHGAKLIANVNENTLTGDFDNNGIKLKSEDGSFLKAAVDSNTLRGDFETGINVVKSDRSKLIASITDNVLGSRRSDFDDAGIKLSSYGSDRRGSKLVATVSGNTLRGEFDESGIVIKSAHDSKLFATIEGNTLLGDFDDAGIEVVSEDDSFLKAKIDSNTLLGDFETGIDVEKDDSSLLIASITNNDLGNWRSDFDEAGIRLTSYGSDSCGSMLISYVAGNTLRGEYDNSGIVAKSYHGSKLVATITRNSLRGEYDNAGIELEAHHGSRMYANVKSNGLRGEFEDAGIEVESFDSADLTATLERNFLVGDFDGDGIKVRSEDGSDLYTSIRSNFLVGEFRDNGISLKSSDGSDLTARIKYNVLSGEFGDSGILGEKEDGSDLDVRIERNWLSGDFDESGIELNGYDSSKYGSELEAVIKGNVLSGDFGNDGITVRSYDSSNVSAYIAENILKGDFDDAGIDIRRNDSSNLEVDIVGNKLLGEERDDSDYRRYSRDNYDVGIRLTSEGSSSYHSGLDAFVAGNRLSGDFETGIEINSDDYASLDAKVIYNRLSGDFEIGIDVNRDGRSEAEVDINRNWLTGDFDEYGIRVTGAGSSHGELEVEADGNVLSGDFDGDGIVIRSEDYAEVDAKVKNNYLSGDFDDTGIKFHSSDRSELKVSYFNNNRIYGRTENGILLIESDSSTLRVYGSGDSNRVYNSDDRFDEWGGADYDFRLNGYRLRD